MWDVRVALALFVAVGPGGCGTSGSSVPGDAAMAWIHDARVFDSHTGAVLPGRSVGYRAGRIVAVVDRSAAPAARPGDVDAAGRLLVPGFVDAHLHTDLVLGDSISEGGGRISRLSAHPDSAAAYARRLAAATLPYGITAVRDLGSDDEYLPILQRVGADRCMPALYLAGGALVSHEEGRTPYPGHRPVRDPADAAATVRSYAGAGVRHIKLYWRLDPASFGAALAEARRLGMNVAAHVDRSFGAVSVRDAIAMGIRDLEHVYPLAIDVMTIDEIRGAWARSRAALEPSTDALFHMGILEHWRGLPAGDPRLDTLTAELVAADVAVTPTLHLFAQRVGRTTFESEPAGPFEDSRGWNAAQRAMGAAGYDRMAAFVASLHRAGVRLATGSDSEDPGRAILSEMLLLHSAGIPMADVLRIASLGSARIAGIDADHGSIEVGKSADFVLLDADPFLNPTALEGHRTVFRSGVQWRDCASP